MTVSARVVLGAAVLSMVMVPQVISAGASRGARQACPSGLMPLREAILDVHERQRNVGVSAAILRDGEIVYSEAFGLADVEFEVPTGTDTRFGIASVSKAFTGTALSLLVEDGLVDPDSDIRHYVSDFPSKGETPITIRMLLAHTSGIPHPGREIRTAETFATHYDRATEAMQLFEDVELEFVPGSDQRYSSSNYNLLAAIIEETSGMSFQDFVVAEMLDPLGMGDTAYDDVRRPQARRAERYSFYHPWTYAESEDLYRVPVWDYSWNAGGGGLISSAEDLVRFAAAFMEPGSLPPGVIERARTTAGLPGWESAWSYGWFVANNEHGLRLSMTGANPGVQAGLTLYPDAGIAAAVLSNTWGVGSRSGEMVELPDRLIGTCLEVDS